MRPATLPNVRHAIRRAFGLWLRFSLPPFLLGFLVIWIGAEAHRLPVMRAGVFLCLPFVLGMYVIFGVCVAAIPALAAWTLIQGVRRALRARWKRQVPTPTGGLWDRELDD